MKINIKYVEKKLISLSFGDKLSENDIRGKKEDEKHPVYNILQQKNRISFIIINR